MAFEHVRVSKQEEKELRQEKILTDDDLWRVVGKDFEAGIEDLAGRTGIPRDRLIEILAGCVVKEPEPAEPRRLAWASQHALDLLALFAVLFLTFLSLRAGGWLSGWPAPWGLTEKIPVTAKLLQKGHVVRSTDIVEAWFNPEPGQFRNPRDVEGFRLAKDLPTGSLIHFADVQREQIVALRDIARGSPVPAEAIASRWSAYHPDAVLDPWKVIGRQLQHSVHKGEVISEEQIGRPAGSRAAPRRLRATTKHSVSADPRRGERSAGTAVR